MKKRIVSLVLAVSLCASLFVAPASAAFDFSLSLADIEVNLNAFFSETNNDNYKPFVCNSYWARSHYDTYSYSSLESYVLGLNSTSEQYGFKFDIQPLENTNFYGVRILYQTGSFGGGRQHNDKYASYVVAWLSDELGNAVLSTPGTSSITSVRAIPRSQAVSVGFYKMLSYEDLYNLAYDYNAQHNYKLALNTDGVYWAISSRGDYVLANESGLPYGAVGPSAVNGNGNSRPTTNTDVIGDTIIDWLNQSVSNAQGDTITYDNCTYDSSSKTYYVDAHQEITNNYYNYSYTYNINNTTITYIGSSAEYTEQYECYYTLPDGRSSADLTKEELEQLNLNIDVVPYDRTTEDTSLWSLYHLDGNTRDDSYWNYRTKFDWNSGASITYLDSGNFNGCLYLDEKAHDFTLEMPSMIGSHYFALEFRYYQSATETPVNDSYVNVGGQTLLRFDGNSMMTGNNTFCADMPVGSWVSIALCRNTSGKLYYYMNGVCVHISSNSTNFNNKITFHFGNEQQTYKYLDEIRVLQSRSDKTHLNRGADYTPAVVPFDTNLSLVLPEVFNNLPSDYIPLDYVSVQGSIFTNFSIEDGYSVDCSISVNRFKDWIGIFGIKAGSHVFGSMIRTPDVFIFSGYNLIGYSLDNFYHLQYSYVPLVSGQSNSFSVDDSFYTSTSYYDLTDADFRLCLFGFRNDDGTFGNQSDHYLSCEYFKVFDANGDPYLSYVPCVRRFDGVVGFYDLVSSSFVDVSSTCHLTGYIDGEVYNSSGLVADEWVSVDYSGDNLVDGDLRSSVPAVETLVKSSFHATRNWYCLNESGHSSFVKGSDISITSYDGLCRIQNNGSAFVPSFDSLSANALIIPFGGSTGNYSSRGYSPGKYTMTVVFSDGSSDSITSELYYDSLSGLSSEYSNCPFLMSSQPHQFSWGKIGVQSYLYEAFPPEVTITSYAVSSQCGFYIAPDQGQSVDIAYIVLEKNSTSTVSASLNSALVNVDMDTFTPTLAVRTDIGITKKQFGGVRPILPGRGEVYAMVENGFITSLQQYDGQAWVQVDGRIWTGSRWVPYSSYNVITLSDMYDIADASGQGGYEYIYSETGFWSWWQKQWLEFKAWYSTLSFTGGGDTIVEGDTINNDYVVDIDFGTARSNSVGLLQFIQTVFGDLTSGFANFTSLYTSPDDSLDVLFPTSSIDE